ncbi:MAG: 16S rRNA (guanine(966)-N(2))-methyltransferase RsmD [Prevotella nanceiensis]|uniref:16S rRNA (guanine(966)-N(2))-methyltransferase RsmD n=1 Tax=Hoylesella nanceiensis TaxID=425941 RepID=UPI001CAFF9A9|nr:16S rRNA (guanine(966)-N(2))-methyltransferase RsmD [Hoylesella nanceiensis]MBF1427057.1 16S rRNA (guanine(966)-N(2))-methyltransferase RsmD [Hoylesella nanceiensis]MBF1441969.1 16S rRNA (guanine(966)-N(2))-methyltransferase RsmD [Hoylesella nanceiensis]
MRVITGKYKGRHFDIPRTFKARPTTDFAKENIFNVLNGYIDFEDCRALDLFAGTGSISIELLSREAQYVVGLELDRDHCAFIRQCIDKLGADNYSLIRGDVFRYLKSCRETFDLIFADPPYALKNLEEIPQIVLDKGILSEDGIFVLEHGKHNHFEEHPCFLERRAYGSVNFSLFKAKPKE